MVGKTGARTHQIAELAPTLPPTVAQQTFIICSGIAAGLAGMTIAKGFIGAKEVPTSAVALATIISVVATFGAGLYLASKAKEVYYG